jgi:hypothetical protein
MNEEAIIPNLLIDIHGDNRYAVTVVATEFDEHGEFIPCVVFEGEKGYRPLRRDSGNGFWHWGKSYDKAMELADKCNDTLGLSKAEACKIIGASMTATAIARS